MRRKNTRYQIAKTGHARQKRGVTSMAARLQRKAVKILTTFGIDPHDTDETMKDEAGYEHIGCDRHKPVRLAAVALEYDNRIRPHLETYLQRRGLYTVAERIFKVDEFLSDTKQCASAKMNASYREPYILSNDLIPVNVYLLHQCCYKCSLRPSRKLDPDWRREIKFKCGEMGTVNIKDGLYTFRIKGDGLVIDDLKETLKAVGFKVRGRSVHCRSIEIKFFTYCQPELGVLDSVAENLGLEFTDSKRSQMEEFKWIGPSYCFKTYKLSDEQATSEGCPRYGWCVELSMDNVKLFGSQTFKKAVMEIIGRLEAIRKETGCDPLHIVGNAKRRGQSPSGRVVVPNNYMCLYKRDLVRKAMGAGKFATDDVMRVLGFPKAARCNRFLECWRDNKSENLQEVKDDEKRRGKDRLWQLQELEPIAVGEAEEVEHAIDQAVYARLQQGESIVDQKHLACPVLDKDHRLPFFSLVPL